MSQRFWSILLIVGSILALTTGDVSWSLVWQGCLDRISGSSNLWNPLLDERLPHLIVLLCSGSSLAVSGLVMQSIFQNPLASPSVLGISSGSSLLVILVFIFNLQNTLPFAIPTAAIGGALLTLICLFSLTRGASLYTLILTGIALSTVLLGVQSSLLFALRENWQLIQTVNEWEAGASLGHTWKHVHMQLPLTIIGLSAAVAHSKKLNILALGEEEALNLGVQVTQIRSLLFFSVAILTGGALAAIGHVTFFGLILPHLLRKLYGPDHNSLVPLSILAGGASFVLLDLFIRSLHLVTLSIGTLSALLGGVYFLYLLYKKNEYPISA